MRNFDKFIIFFLLQLGFIEIFVDIYVYKIGLWLDMYNVC